MADVPHHKLRIEGIKHIRPQSRHQIFLNLQVGSFNKLQKQEHFLRTISDQVQLSEVYFSSLQPKATFNYFQEQGKKISKYDKCMTKTSKCQIENLTWFLDYHTPGL